MKVGNGRQGWNRLRRDGGGGVTHFPFDRHLHLLNVRVVCQRENGEQCAFDNFSF